MGLSLGAKKIIAREGLIILAFLFVAGVMTCSSALMQREPEKHVYTFQSPEGAYEFTTKETWSAQQRFTFLRAMLSDEDKFKEIAKSLGKKYVETFKYDSASSGFVRSVAVSDSITTHYLGPKASLRNLVKDLMGAGWIIILFGIYPIYLLFRFVVWAVATLRKK